MCLAVQDRERINDASLSDARHQVEAAQEENAVLSMELDWLHSAQEDTLQVQC